MGSLLHAKEEEQAFPVFAALPPRVANPPSHQPSASLQETDLLSRLREQISFVSRFPAVPFGSSKPFRRNFGMTHVCQKYPLDKLLSSEYICIVRKVSYDAKLIE
jgi:hypothetical protein